MDTAAYQGMLLPGGDAMELLRIGEWRIQRSSLAAAMQGAPQAWQRSPGLQAAWAGAGSSAHMISKRQARFLWCCRGD